MKKVGSSFKNLGWVFLGLLLLFKMFSGREGFVNPTNPICSTTYCGSNVGSKCDVAFTKNGVVLSYSPKTCKKSTGNTYYWS
jgi:hypothetical protein